MGRCEKKGGGFVQCCQPAGHDGPHLYRCAGPYCPGYSWIASNTPHPTSCTVETLNTTEQVDRLRMPLPPRL